MKFNRKEMEESLKVAESMKEHAEALEGYFAAIGGTSMMLIVDKVKENPEISPADITEDFTRFSEIARKGVRMSKYRKFFENIAEEIKRQIGEEGEENA